MATFKLRETQGAQHVGNKMEMVSVRGVCGGRMQRACIIFVHFVSIIKFEEEVGAISAILSTYCKI